MRVDKYIVALNTPPSDEAVPQVIDTEVPPDIWSEAPPADEPPADEALLPEDEELPPDSETEETKPEEETKAEEEEVLPAKPADVKTKERPLAWLLQLGASPRYRIFTDFAGEAMEEGRGAMGLSFDVMTPKLESGARFYFGADFHGWSNAMFAGLRLGAAGDVTDHIFLKLGANLGYIGIEGADDDSQNVPIELNNPPVTSDGTAYSFNPVSMDMSMKGGALTISPELAVTFKRWALGGGKTISLGAFIALEAGIYLAAVTDEGCNYAYDPYAADRVEVRPDGSGNASFEQTSALDSRCRADEPSYGTIFGGEAGLTLEFGL